MTLVSFLLRVVPMMRAAIVLVALTLAPCGAIAVAQTRECMDVGPDKGPSWALLPETSKWKIFAQQQAVDRGKEEERQSEVYKRRWRDAANHAVSPWMAIPISTGSTGSALIPRLTDDHETLVLMEEVRSPAKQRQPEISLGTTEASGSPRIQIAGEGIAPLPTIAIACAWSRRSIPLSGFSQEPHRAVASYEVPESIAVMARDEASCHIALAGAVLQLPRDMVALVWRAIPRK